MIPMLQAQSWGQGRGTGVDEMVRHSRSAVEVVFGREDDRFVGLDALDFVGPLASDLDRRLDRFGTSVHHECHLESSEL